MSGLITPQILIGDYGTGAQAEKISEILREGGYSSVAVSFCSVISDQNAPRGIILCSSGEEPLHPPHGSHPSFTRLFQSTMPVLAMGYAMYELVQSLGGTAHTRRTAHGALNINVKLTSSLFLDTDERQVVWGPIVSLITRPPDGFDIVGWHTTAGWSTHEHRTMVALECEEKKKWGIDIDPCDSTTRFGRNMLINFARHCCGCEAVLPPAWRAKERHSRFGT